MHLTPLTVCCKMLRMDLPRTASKSWRLILMNDRAQTLQPAAAAGACTEDMSDIVDSSIQPRREAHLSLPQRRCADSHTCAYGKTLLQFGEAADEPMPNGRTADGHFACRLYSTKLKCSGLFPAQHPMPAIVVGAKCAGSDHCPLTRVAVVIAGCPMQ